MSPSAAFKSFIFYKNKLHEINPRARRGSEQSNLSVVMIRFLLLQNRAGKTRLAKYYSPFSDEEKSRMEDEVHRLVATRDSKFSNFLEVYIGGGALGSLLYLFFPLPTNTGDAVFETSKIPYVCFPFYCSTRRIS